MWTGAAIPTGEVHVEEAGENLEHRRVHLPEREGSVGVQAHVWIGRIHGRETSKVLRGAGWLRSPFAHEKRAPGIPDPRGLLHPRGPSPAHASTLGGSSQQKACPCGARNLRSSASWRSHAGSSCCGRGTCTCGASGCRTS